MAIHRASRANPCVVCGGHPDLERGKGIRCTGFATDDGWIHCTREELAGRCRRHDGAVEPTWSHRASGPCPCGQEHAPSNDLPPSRSQSQARASRQAEVRPIGDAKGAEIVATYDYRDIKGRLLYQVCRMHPKSFRQRRKGPDGEWIWNLKGITPTLYQIPAVVAGLQAGDTVWIVEGEKDVHALMDAGQVATCNSGGCGKWRDEFAGLFAKFAVDGGEIRIIQDLDPLFDPQGRVHQRGQKHARQVYESLVAALPDSIRVAIYEPAEGKDAADHLAAGRTVEEFRQVFPFPDDLLETDPQRFKRHQIRAALEAPAVVLDRISRDHVPTQQPTFPTGLVGSQKLKTLQGATVLAGAASAGKSILAMETAIHACSAGWEVFYLSCEMHEDIVFDRAIRALAGSQLSQSEWNDQLAKNRALLSCKTLKIPENLFVVNVDVGVTIEAVVEMLCQSVTDRPTLVVLDSISSFVDNLEEDDRNDPFKMKALRDVVKLCVATRRLTHGHVAWLLLSELNKEGKAKGRFLEHRCDFGLAMESHKEHSHLKTIRVSKSWWSPIGELGDFVLEYELCHLRRLEPDPIIRSPYPEEEDDLLL